MDNAVERQAWGGTEPCQQLQLLNLSLPGCLEEVGAAARTLRLGGSQGRLQGIGLGGPSGVSSQVCRQPPPTWSRGGGLSYAAGGPTCIACRRWLPASADGLDA